MVGNAPKSPTTRGINDITDRIQRLKLFCKAADLQAEAVETMRDRVGPELWDSYFDKLDVISRLLWEADQVTELVRERLNPS